MRGRALISVALIASAIAWYMLPTPYSPATRAFVLWIAGIGIFFFLRVVLAIAGLVDTARSALRLGYPPGLLLEVMLDHWSDTAAIVGATGAYQMVRERTLRRVRRLRVFGSSLHVAAAVLPLPLTCLALLLAFRHATDRIAFILIPTFPFVFCAITAVILHAYAAILVQWDRAGDAWDPSPVGELDRAHEWQREARALTEDVAIAADTSIDANTPIIADAPPPAPRARGVLFALAVTAGAVFTFVVAVSVIASALGFASLSQYRLANRSLAPDFGSATGAEFMRYLRLARDSSVSARQAGDAYHALLYPTGNVESGMRQPVQRFATPLWPSTVPWLPSGDYYWRLIVERDATRGLAGPARATLDSLMRMPPHPALALLHTLAVAPAIDVTAARYRDDINPRLIGSGLYASHDLWLAATLDAAKTFARGDIRTAELKLREMLSAGILLIDGSPYRTDFHTGAELVEAAHNGLTYIYAHSGRPEAAAAMKQARRVLFNSGWLGGYYSYRNSAAGQLWGLAGTAGIYPSVRWTAFQNALPAARCQTLRTVLFGLSDDDAAALQDASHRIILMRSDSLLLKTVLGDTLYPRPLPRRPGFRRLVRATRFLLTDRLVDSPCLAAVTTRF
jgi:hypothetical protein